MYSQVLICLSLSVFVNIVQCCKITTHKVNEICYSPLDLGRQSYRGKLSKTESGKTCQAWSQQTPHKHDALKYDGDSNYCRNPAGDEPRPWCYTMTSTRWEYCSVPICPNRDADCYSEQDYGQYSYAGKKIRTGKGLKCQHWKSQTPHRHDPKYAKDDNNYCRNPAGDEPRPWCYTVDPNVRWQYCDQIPMCKRISNMCYNRDDKGKNSYRGSWNKTRSGKPCEKWRTLSKSEPLSFYYKSTDHGESNYCRNNDEAKSKPYCLVKQSPNAQPTREECNLPVCPPTPRTNCYWKLDKGQASYAGTMNRTESGRTCQHWYKQKPHEHYLIYYGEENYCRNPGGHEPRLWCYTTDPNKRWEFCNVPTCY